MGGGIGGEVSGAKGELGREMFKWGWWIRC